MTAITDSKAWKKLVEHHQSVQATHMRDFFAQNPQRFDELHLKFNDIIVDYSKNKITNETLNLLIDLVKEADLSQWRKKLFTGEKINFTENRAALHTALRNQSNKPVLVDGVDIMPAIKKVRAQMTNFSNAVRSGKWQGFTGKKIKTIVNIGIGGSDLGPAMVCKALKAFGHPELTPIFVSNVDGTDIAQALQQCDPETTLFIVASKTFNTQETMTNAATAREWLLTHFGNDKAAIRAHFVAVSTNKRAVSEFGIDVENMFEFWDWVGGRYSLWSAIGLAIAVYLGMDHYEALLSGAHEMDQHFLDAPLEKNIPVLLAMIGIWYINFFEYNTLAILPYDQGLSLLPSYLQQADMESNGKFIGRDDERVSVHTGPIVWGESGTNGQHAFYQLIHQGTDIVPTDFIMPIKSQYRPNSDAEKHHKVLISNFIAQTRALMMGKTEGEVRRELFPTEEDYGELEHLVKHKSFQGNRPSNSIIFEELNPKTLGSLLAIYEHKIFVQGVIWNINSFDQWGVEYGKQIANLVLPELNVNRDTTAFDSSTNNLINNFKKNR